MIGRRGAPPEEPEVDDAMRGFDDFELRLGDIMRGERATLGKSLLDVQRELKIKASYIAAIENSDPSAFETPGFVAGYVRSYARYLGLDPDWTFSKFCEEGGFTVTHGLSANASGGRAAKIDASKSSGIGRDPFEQPNTPFVPRVESIFSRIEPGALGSTLVLVALIGFIACGGWSVLQEVQRVEFAPVNQTPGVTAEVDPLAPADVLAAGTVESTTVSNPGPEALDRLYRPQALDVPVMTARDAPIATLDPNRVATVLQVPSETPTQTVDRPLVSDPVSVAVAEALGVPVSPSPPVLDGPREPGVVQVREQDIPEVVVVAAREAWVRVRSADGQTTLFVGNMAPNESWVLPKTEKPPLLRTGNAGGVYFLVDGEPYGPAGQGANIEEAVLAASDLRAVYQPTNDLQDVDVGAIIQEAIAKRAAAAQ